MFRAPCRLPRTPADRPRDRVAGAASLLGWRALPGARARQMRGAKRARRARRPRGTRHTHDRNQPDDPLLTVRGATGPTATSTRAHQPDENYRLERCWLAERWEPVNDGATWRFHLEGHLPRRQALHRQGRGLRLRPLPPARRQTRVNAAKGSAVGSTTTRSGHDTAPPDPEVPWQARGSALPDRQGGHGPVGPPHGHGPFKFITTGPTNDPVSATTTTRTGPTPPRSSPSCSSSSPQRRARPRAQGATST